MWNPFRSKLAAAILGGVDKIHIKPGSKVLYLGAASETTVSHVADIVGPVSALVCENVCYSTPSSLLLVCVRILQPTLPPPPCLLTYLLYHSLHSITTHSITNHSITTHSITTHSIPSHSITLTPSPLYPITIHFITISPFYMSPNHSSPSTHSHTHRRVWCMLWSSLTAQGGT